MALKQLRDGAATPRRFEREVHLTARLQHPGIVPVYDAGDLPDGAPFYAMRLLDGRSLDQVIAEAPTLKERLTLLPQVMAAVDAVAYAHGQGIIHRDLKPQNILVGEFGETVVVDWGLAKDLEDASDVPEEDDVRVTGTAGAGGTTQHGEVMGTLAYMAPEQAAGGRVDRRADVYGLGATLYHVLSGAPPHAAGGARVERPPPLEDRVAGLPPDLTAIVTRAMAPAPEVRYPSARELATDLRRFHTGRLVEAHRYSRSQLLARWTGRHRVAVTVAAVAVVVITVLSALGLRRILAERRVAEHQRSRAETQRAAAERLVGYVLGGLRDQLELVGRLDVLAGVGGEVEAYYAELQRELGDTDPAQQATALGVVGDARLVAGDANAALETQRAALAVLERAAADRPGGALDNAICHVQLRVGLCEQRLGHTDAAAAAVAACEAVARRRLETTPDDDVFRELLARSLFERAQSAWRRRDAADAQRLLTEALVPALGAGQDASFEATVTRSNIYAKQGEIAQALGDYPAASQAWEAALVQARRAAEARPDSPRAQQLLATGWDLAGRARQQRSDLAGAEEAYRAARDVQQKWAERDPDNLDWLQALGVAEQNLGLLALQRGDPAAAVERMSASREVAARLVIRSPTNPDWRRDLGISDLQLGLALAEAGRPAEARAVAARSIATYDALLAEAPTSEVYLHDIAAALVQLADLEADHDRGAAIAAIDRSIGLRRRVLAGADADAAMAASQLAESLLASSEIRWIVVADRAVARAHAEEAGRLLDPLRGDAAGDAELAQLIAAVDATIARMKR